MTDADPAQTYARLLAIDGEADALRVPGLVSVRAFGARGDADGSAGSGADDTAALAAGLAAGGLLYVPPGTFRFGPGAAAGVPALTIARPGTILVLDRNATLFFDSTTSGAVGIEVAASSLAILGHGCVRGRWDTALNGSDAVGRSRDGTVLLRVRPPRSGGDPVSDLWVEGVTFARAGGYAVRHVPNLSWYQRLSWRRCRFVENYVAWHLTAPTTSARNASGIAVVDCSFDGTAAPAPGTYNSNLGGNAITVTGPVDGLRIAGNRIAGCGRMGIEVWSDTLDLQLGRTTRDLTVSGNQLGPCGYRTLSLGAVGAVVEGNTVTGAGQGRDYVELGGDHYGVRRNRLAGSGLLAKSTASSLPAWKGEGLQIAENELDDAPEGVGVGIAVHGYRDVVIRDNRLRFRHAVKAGQPAMACLDLFAVDRMSVRRNEISFGAGCNRGALLQASLCRRGEIDGNLLRLEGAASPVDSLLWLAALEAVEVAGNRTVADREAVLPAIVGGLGGGYDGGLIRLRRLAGAWRQDACEGGIRREPPAAPVAGQVYVIGEVPAGAWSGHPRCFAEWDGAGWRFDAIADVRLHSEARGLVASLGPPGQAADGGAVLLAERGFIRCSYRGNDVAAGNTLRDRSGHAGVAADGTDVLYWDARFVANRDALRIRRDAGIAGFEMS